jgi:hypothetical protein
VTLRELNEEPIEADIASFLGLAKARMEHYPRARVFNTDQSGYSYEMVSTRTLSHKGEKVTECVVGSMNKVTHSYTIQVTISADGHLVGPVYLCLKETGGSFGPRVQESLEAHQNVFIVCSQSGKLTKHLFKQWCETLLPDVQENSLLLKDSWTGQSDQNIFDEVFGDKLETLTIPPKTTGKIQALDVFFFGQWKKFYRRASDYVKLHQIDIDITLRNNVIRMHSLIHNQVSCPVFAPMIRYAWAKSGYFEESPEPFQSVTQVCFKLNHAMCCHSGCGNYGFICCSWCREILCFGHFFNDLHFH